MCTHIEQADLLFYKLKTKRQKIRLAKKDQSKQMIAIHKEEENLRQQKKMLPLVPLDQPYQKGWKRFFVLREDVARSKYADFYESLLEKINTIVYSKDRTFKRKKRRLGKRIWVVREQKLRELSACEWQRNSLKLDEKEKMHFHPVERVHKNGVCIVYVFNDPWRFRLKVAPHMITHIKKLDQQLESESRALENTIVRQHLRSTINRLTYGKSYRWVCPKPEDKKKNNILKQPVKNILDYFNEED